MPKESPLRAAIISAAATFILLFVLTLFLRLPLIYCLLTACVTGALVYGLINGLTKKMMGSLSQINELIVNALSAESYKQRIVDDNSEIIEQLSASVRQLIKEKANEIENLRQLEQMRKDFLGDVAHELRSPVFNIQGYLHTLNDGAISDENVSRLFLEKAVKNVDHLQALVEDLVTITRLESGDLQLEISSFDIKKLILEVIELQDLNAKKKNIALIPKFDTSTPIYVSADKIKIRQVLNNLISNSIKYGSTDGHTHVNVLSGQYNITVEVADNGEGIGEEHLPRIFERFYRVDKSRARTEQSTGLGLAIVKHFIEAHQQHVYVTSRKGIGSIFSFTLEKAQVAEMTY